MRTITKNEADFDELFRFAEKRFGIGWNDCCSLFHRSNVLNYHSHTEFWLCDIIQQTQMYYDKGENVVMPSIEEMSDEEIKSAEHEKDKAYLIIGKFMIEHSVDKVFILGTGDSG